MRLGIVLLRLHLGLIHFRQGFPWHQWVLQSYVMAPLQLVPTFRWELLLRPTLPFQMIRLLLREADMVEPLLCPPRFPLAMVNA